MSQTLMEKGYTFMLKKLAKPAMALLAITGLLAGLNFMPVLNLRTAGMNEIKGNWVTVYYEKEMSAAQGVLALADPESQRIAGKLGFDSPQNICLYVYDKQKGLGDD